MSSIFNEFFKSGQKDREPSEIIYENEKPKNKDTIKIKARIEGVVQGVGFRYTTKHLADKLDVCGIVQNENDGSVYVEALGTDTKMEEFINELAKGPSPSAKVNKVSIKYDDSIKNYNGFGTRH